MNYSHPQFDYYRKTYDAFFDNIGNKLKKLAKISFIIQSIFFLVVAVLLGLSLGAAVGLLIALLVAAFFIFTSWIICSVLYGFGEIVERSTEIAYNTSFLSPHQEKKKTFKEAFKSAEKIKNKKQTSTPKTEETTTPDDEDEFITFECPYCGEELAMTADEISSSITCPYCSKKIK